MSKQLSKEELELDPLIQTIGKVTNFYQANKTAVLSIGIGIIVVLSSVIGYSYYADAQEEEAQALLAAAEQYYTDGDYTRALNGDDADLTLGMLQIVNNYSGTDAGNLATYYASVSHFKLGQFEDALAYIQNYTAPSGILGVGSISYHANVLSQLGNHEEAAAKYERAASWDTNDSTTPYNLLQAAKEYSKAGNTAKALTLIESIIEDYPTSVELGDAQRMKGTLSNS